MNRLFKNSGWNNLFQQVFGTTCSKYAKRSALIAAAILIFAPTSFAIIDTNNNGVSDLWEEQVNNGNLIPNLDLNADFDGDGWTAAMEAAAGTDPNNANPPNGFIRPETAHVPAFWGEENGQPVLITPESITITWPVTSGKKYTLQFSVDLSAGSWITVGTPFIGDEAVVPLYGFLTAEVEKRFWRVAVTDVDTDSDGLTNAEEAHYGTNPDSKDTDGDGLGDKAEVGTENSPVLVDTDEDGIPDKSDVLSETLKIFNWVKEEPVRYAGFPVPLAQTIIQVNDQGIILTTDGLWKNGVFTPLALSSGSLLRGCTPLSMGDNGFILGVGEIDLPDDDHVSFNQCLVTWKQTPPSTVSVPHVLRSGTQYLCPLTYITNLEVTPLDPSDLWVNRHGQFVATLANSETATSNGKTYKSLKAVTHENNPILSLNVGTEGSDSAPHLKNLPTTSIYAVGDQDHIVHELPNGRLKLDAFEFPEHYNRIVRFDGTRLIAVAGYESPASFDYTSSEYPMVQSNGSWVECRTLTCTTDYASEPKIAAQDFWSLYHNGRDFLAHELFPNQQPDWETSGVKRIIDISPRGIALQMRKENNQLSTIMGIPLRLQTGGVAKGIDNLSVTARAHELDTPAQLAGNKKEFWLMVPAGDSLAFDLESGASSQTPLTLESSEGITFTDATVSSGNAQITVAATAGLAGQEHNVNLKIGNVTCATTPLKIKVMKRRNVSVSVYPLRRPNHTGTPPEMPSGADIETYIDGIFKKQIGTDFAVTVHPVSNITTDPGTSFNVYDPPAQHQKDIAATRLGGKIRIFVLLDYDEVWGDGGLFYAGYANPGTGFNYAWLGVENLKLGMTKARRTGSIPSLTRWDIFSLAKDTLTMIRHRDLLVFRSQIAPSV